MALWITSRTAEHGGTVGGKAGDVGVAATPVRPLRRALAVNL
jgi:hypothetical protein